MDNGGNREKTKKSKLKSKANCINSNNPSDKKTQNKPQNKRETPKHCFVF